MIKRLVIENFQSHKKTEIEFCPGVNVITGRSDSGKSTILRALYWALWNRPTGFAFHSYFAKPGAPTRVKVEFTDGSFIERIKSDKENKYIVNGVELKALGTQVPEEVLQVHQLDEFNVQTQFENYFLLQDSPGEVARKLNRVVGLDVIDDLIKRANSLVNSLRSQVSESESRIEELEEEIRSYEFLDEVEPLMVEAESKIQELGTLGRELDTLKGLISDLGEVEKELEDFVDVELLEKELHWLEEKIVSLEQTLQELAKLSGVVKELEQVWLELSGFDRFGDFEELEAEVEEVHSLVDRLDRAEEKLANLQSWADDWLGVSRLLNRTEELLDGYVEEYLKLIGSTGICPVCKSSITKECVEELKEELLS